MKLVERGVLEASEIYLFNGSPFTEEFFYHLICTGHYFCNGLYRVSRNSLDSYLLIYVVEGKGYVEDRKGRHELRSGEMALLNCYERPSYGTETGWEMYWIHFDGHEISKLYPFLSHKIAHYPLKEVVMRAFEKIITPFENGSQPTEAIINKYITNLLTEFFESDKDEALSEKGKRFQVVYNYITQNLDKTISLDDLAALANLSRYYFIRAFKEETGYTPHEYIIRARINTAIFFLTATSLTLTEITYKCGFSSESAFNNTFRNMTGSTPLQYRKSAMSLSRDEKEADRLTSLSAT